MAEEIVSIPKEIFEEAGLVLDPRLHNFLVRTGRTSKVSDLPSWSTAVSSVFLAKSLERSLNEHAHALSESAQAAEKQTEALVKAAQASEKHTASLTLATWILAGFTLVLAFITALGI